MEEIVRHCKTVKDIVGYSKTVKDIIVKLLNRPGQAEGIISALPFEPPYIDASSDENTAQHGWQWKCGP